MPKRTFTAFIDHENRIIKPISVPDFNFLITGFEHCEKVTVTVESFIREKSLSQMGLLHKYIKLISDYTGQDQAEVKIEMKKRFGIINDSGKLKSTADYSSEEMGKLIDGTHNFANTELDMNLPTPEEFKNKNLK